MKKSIYSPENLHRNLAIFLLPLFMAGHSCKNVNDDFLEMPPLYPAPRSVAVDTVNGYRVNQLTGDPVLPVIISTGDTIRTGVSLELEGRILSEEELPAPRVVKAGKPGGIPLNANVQKLPVSSLVVPVNNDSLKVGIPGMDSSFVVIVNSYGDTVRTGVPLVAKGKVLRVESSVSQALPPGIVENTRMSIKTLTRYHGLASEGIYKIFQDTDDKIWILTDGGVNKYDGRTFTKYKIPYAFTVTDMIQDSSGNLWFCSYDGGIIKYDGMTFIQFSEKDGLCSNHVFSTGQDGMGNLWFGTVYGAITFDGHSFMNITGKEGLNCTAVLSIYEDHAGNLWFGTQRNGAIRYNGLEFTNLSVKNGLSDNFVVSIKEDRHDKLWFRTGKGISSYDGECVTNYTDTSLYCYTYLHDIELDNNGMLWISGINGVTIFDGTSFFKIQGPSEHNNKPAADIFEDDNGSIWLGTPNNGVNIYSGNTFINFFDQSVLRSYGGFSILEDDSGNLWFSMDGNGVARYNGESIFHFTEEAGLENNFINSLIEDRAGNLWFCTSDGLIVYNGQTFTNYMDETSSFLLSVFEDNSGNVWTGSQLDGLSVYREGAIEQYSEKQGISSNYIWEIKGDNTGNPWFCTSGGGLIRYNGSTFKHYTEKEGLSNNYVSYFFEDSRGLFWIGTQKGINVFDGGIIAYITESEGLTNNEISSIQEDSTGAIWVGTLDGLNVLQFDSVYVERNSLSTMKTGKEAGTPALKFSNLKIHTFNLQDGLQDDDFSSAVLLDSKNRLWWGTRNNFTMLDLKNFMLPSEAPGIQLNDIAVNNEAINLAGYAANAGKQTHSKEGSSLSGQTQYPVFPFNKNHLTFHFTATDWAAPHKVRYSYRMKGLKENWSQPTENTIADYRSLPGGRYTFMVRSIGSALEWSNAEEFSFRIKPPFWLSWWAILIYAGAALWMVLLYTRTRTAALQKRQKELEQEVNERTREIISQKEEIESQRDVLAIQRDLVLEQKQEITDSITYAKRIQTAVLPSSEILDQLLPEHFVLFKPRDIVSGDFYWIKQVKNFTVVVAADCTGHGVPGAFMSMLGVSMLNEIVGRSRLDSAGEFLDRLRSKIKTTLSQEGKALEQKDGMDMSLAILDSESGEMQYAGAFNPIYIIRQANGSETQELEPFMSIQDEHHVLYEIKGDRQPISIYSKEKEFTTHQVNLRQGDSLYMFSDGYPDQIGGPEGKKFMVKQFKKILLGIQVESMADQQKILENTLAEWTRETTQVDDILVFGIKWESKEDQI